jgi:Rieske Fe-S protein
MPGEDQERFEDYLELERYIEELQAGRVAHPPRNLTPEQARIYRTAALFRSTSPDAATPRPEFAEALRNRLLALDQENDEDDTEKMAAVKKTVQPAPPAPTMPPVEEPPAAPQEVPQVQEPPAELEVPAPPRKEEPRRKSFVSRRSLLTGSAVAAASLVVGGGIGAVAERSATTSMPPTAKPTPGNYEDTPLVQDGIWQRVATLDQIGEDALRFTTDTIVGYLMRSDDDEDGEKKGEIIALSAACTHMGCIVQWDGSDHQFHCPCHGGVFTEYGKPSPTSSFKYLASLPRMTTQVRGNEVYVLVPKKYK